MDDAKVATDFLYYLARKFDRASLAYSEPPARISGGFDASIFGFAIDDAPAALRGPLILRLNRPQTGADRVKLEAIVHNWLAGQGYSIPDVRLSELDPSVLGGRFTVMERLAGKPLAAEVDRVLSGGSIVTKVVGLTRLPGIARGITEQWVDAQIRLHALDPAPLVAAVVAGGLDPAVITFDGQLKNLANDLRRFGLSGLQPAVDWLQTHRPSGLRDTVCH